MGSCPAQRVILRCASRARCRPSKIVEVAVGEHVARRGVFPLGVETHLIDSLAPYLDALYALLLKLCLELRAGHQGEIGLRVDLLDSEPRDREDKREPALRVARKHKEAGLVDRNERDAKHRGIDVAYQHHEPRGRDVKDVCFRRLILLTPLSRRHV